MNGTSDLSSNIHELIITDYLRAEKSALFYELLKEMDERQSMSSPNVFMMVRPRGFGLSLCARAMNSVLERTRDFTAAARSEEELSRVDALPRHHVLLFNLRKVASKTPREFRDQLLKILQQLYWEHHLNGAIGSYTTPKGYFADLIAQLSERHGEKVVVLVDNYDIPLIMASMMDRKSRDEAVAMYFEMLNVLRHEGAHLQYAFLSGHIKFKLASERSEGLPLVADLSFNEKYDALFGFTRDETEELFRGPLETLAQQRGVEVESILDALERIYGGFAFSDRLVRVICPMCVNHALANGLKFLPYTAGGDYAFLKRALERGGNDFNWLFDKDGQDPLHGYGISLEPEGKDLGSLLIQLGFATPDRVTEHEAEGFSTWRYRYVCPNEDMRRTLEILRGKKASEYALEEIEGF